jgi:hypothetical protein
MPRLPQPTAQGRSAIADVPGASPWHFGAQAFGQITAFGEQIQKAAETIKARQDELDLTKADDAYRLRMDAITQAIAKEPDLTKHRDVFDKGIADAQKEVRQMYPNLSSAAQQVLEGTFSKRTTTTAIDTAHLTQKMGVTQVLTDYDQLANNRVNRAAMSADPVLAAAALNEIDDHRNRNVATGMMDAAAAQKDAEARQDQYWKIAAQHRPGHVLGLQGDNDAVMAMDPMKRQEYMNLATNTLRAQTLANEQAVKQEQDLNARRLTADILEGKPIGTAIVDLTRSGQLDDKDARTLDELRQKVAMRPNLARYVPGLAGNMEANFRTMKYSMEPLPDGIEMMLANRFIDGSIAKEEMTHLMGVWQSVVDHRSTTGNEGGNRTVTHAHGNLIRSLRTTGPADKFDALSEQTITEAERFFYNRLEADPKADPWAVMKEAEGIFKPVIKDRLNMSKTDATALNDAKMDGLLHTKAISPATYKAWQEQKRQQKLGEGIVRDTLQNLPPPEAEGFQKWLDSLKSWWPKPEETP